MIYLAVPVPEDISNLASVLKKSFVPLESQIMGFELSMMQPSGAMSGEMAAGSHSSAPPWITVTDNKKCLGASGPSLLLSQIIKKPRAWAALKKMELRDTGVAADRGFLPMQVGIRRDGDLACPPSSVLELGQGLAIHLNPQSGKVQLGEQPLSSTAKFPSVIKQRTSNEGGSMRKAVSSETSLQVFWLSWPQVLVISRKTTDVVQCW